MPFTQSSTGSPVIDVSSHTVADAVMWPGPPHPIHRLRAGEGLSFVVTVPKARSIHRERVFTYPPLMLRPSEHPDLP